MNKSNRFCNRMFLKVITGTMNCIHNIERICVSKEYACVDE